MNRNSCITALVLASRQSGENNRSVTLFSPEKGLVYAMLYGGPKSKLRSLVSPYHSGKMWLYTDEAKHRIKITDFDVTEYRPEIRENLFKTWAASLCAELLIRTTGGAEEYAAHWTLAKGFLDGLAIAPEASCRTGLLRFLWRCIVLSGVQPDTGNCVRCSAPVGQNSGSICYSAAENGFLCPDCAQGTPYDFTLSAPAVQYLDAVSALRPADVRRIPVTPLMTRELSQFLFFLIQRDAGTPLKTLQAGLSLLM